MSREKRDVAQRGEAEDTGRKLEKTHRENFSRSRGRKEDRAHKRDAEEEEIRSDEMEGYEIREQTEIKELNWIERQMQENQVILAKEDKLQREKSAEKRTNRTITRRATVKRSGK